MNMQYCTKIPVSIAALLGAAFLLATSPLKAEGSDWEYGGAIYIWGSKMNMTTPAGDKAKIPFYQILDDLQFTLMGLFGARNDKWSITNDLIYMNIKQGKERDATFPDGGSIQLTGSVQMKSWIVTPTVGYAFYNTDQARVEVLGGVRYLWIDVGLKISANGQPIFDESGSEGFWDGIVGMRATVNLNDRWYVPLYADVGWGNSDGTWQGLAGVGYRFSKFNTSLAYRYLYYKFDDIPTLSKLVIKGPFASFSIMF